MADVDVIRRMYELWTEGDRDAAFALLDADVVAFGHPNLPDPGPVHGREAVREWMRGLLEAWDVLLVDVEQLIEAGDNVVVLFQLRGRGRGSGVEVSSGHDAHVWTLRDGKVVAVRWYQGTADALRETGVT